MCTYTPCSFLHYSQWPWDESNPNVFGEMKWQRKKYAYVNSSPVPFLHLLIPFPSEKDLSPQFWLPMLCLLCFAVNILKVCFNYVDLARDVAFDFWKYENIHLGWFDFEYCFWYTESITRQMCSMLWNYSIIHLGGTLMKPGKLRMWVSNKFVFNSLAIS